MCGIFGIILNNRNENIYKLVINGLAQLQNRGYDSAGISILKDDAINVYKYASTNEENALEKLEKLNFVKDNDNTIYSIMGHNRWATHGIKNDTNAHPHLSNNKKFSIVHNGIIENYNELKQQLIKNGYIFHSQTDTEVIVNLIEYNYKDSKKCKNTFEAIEQTIKELRGTYGLLIQSVYEPDKLFCVRNGSPLLIGQNEDRCIITSEQSGFCNMVNNYITLHNDDICVIEKTNSRITTTTTHSYTKKNVTLIESELTPFPYEHWTLKEINEQPNVVLNSINKGGRIKGNAEVKLGGLEQHIGVLQKINNVIILGCGTSYFAGLYGMYYFKQLCNFNTVQVFDGAEFNEFDIPKIGNTCFILVSQSGETKDLHRCIEIAKHKNITTIGIINVVDSLIAREVDCGIYCNAGKEVGVASTKAFTSQVVCLSMTAIWFADLHAVNLKKRTKMVCDLHNLSNDVENTLELCKTVVRDISEKIASNHLFLLGKGSDEYIAREGSLKIKEISYIHCEGYSSSSLKHGPFALLDENFPVIILNLDQSHRAKTLNCYQEVKSRNSPIVMISNDRTIAQDVTCDVILVPENKSYASLLGIMPIQLLAYYLSVKKGINPDKPKNLAKVVTVE
jgi:glucosamine--fructose-6-phosphate aminotransferase (isomerizing)